MTDSDDESLELDRLAAQLRVSQSPAIPARHIVGGSDTLSRRDPEEVQGMSRRTVGITVETVGMEEETFASLNEGEEQVDMFGPSDGARTSSSSKKSRVYISPIDTEDFNEVCHKLIGSGTVFCTARNCTVSHRGGAVMTVTPGDIFVAKSSTEAFVEPRMSSFNIDEQALQHWVDASLSFEAWSEKFLMAEAAGDEEPASVAAMEVQEHFYRNKALNFKTPAKNKRTPKESRLELLSSVTYSPLFKDDEDLILGDLSEVSGLMSRFDQTMSSMSETMMAFLEDYKDQSDLASVAISSLWLRLATVEGRVGSRPVVLPNEYQAPSAWGSIGQLAIKVDNVHSLAVSASDVEKILKALETKLQAHVIDQVSVAKNVLNSKSRGLRTFVVDIARSLGKRISDLEINGSTTTQSATPPQGLPTQGDYQAEMETRLLTLEAQVKDSNPPPLDLENLNSTTVEVGRLEKRFESMDIKVGKLLAKGDDLAIKFSGLGFTKPTDANSWLEKELPHHPSGLIVDAHMVFERIFYNMDNSDTLQRLQQCYKIKVTTIADGVAITSFDSKMPKFFSRSHGHKVVKSDGSFFDAIGSYQEWDDPATGYRLRLQEELSNFEDIHGTYLDEYFSHESGQGYSVSRLALTESMAWIEGFITFMDTYYRELTKAKFGSSKAWHVTTRLAKRVLDEVGTTRQSAQGGFEAGNAVKICQNIVWAVLKAHDVMAEYKRLAFKNHPSVATELVKFLAINTSFEAIEKLVAKVGVLEADASEMKKQVSAAVKASASAANKADEVRKQSDSLIKRIAKLEQK
jgi:hypothetical protein